MLTTLICSFCHDEIEVEVTQEELDKWETGEYFVDDCFPKMKPEHREMLLSGLCPMCYWRETLSFFGDDDYDEDY